LKRSFRPDPPEGWLNPQVSFDHVRFLIGSQYYHWALIIDRNNTFSGQRDRLAVAFNIDSFVPETTDEGVGLVSQIPTRYFRWTSFSDNGNYDAYGYQGMPFFIRNNTEDDRAIDDELAKYIKRYEKGVLLWGLI
jgi:hypothetical protein